jgi:hypothetical protein
MDLKKHAESLRPALDEAEREEAEVLEQLAELRENRRRLQRAMAALVEPPKGSSRRKRTTSDARRGSRVSDEKRALVASFVEKHPEGVTVSEVQEGLGLSRSATDTTLRALREQPDAPIRLAGKQGTAMIYKPMPKGGGSNGAGS